MTKKEPKNKKKNIMLILIRNDIKGRRRKSVKIIINYRKYKLH